MQVAASHHSDSCSSGHCTNLSISLTALCLAEESAAVPKLKKAKEQYIFTSTDIYACVDLLQ